MSLTIIIILLFALIIIYITSIVLLLFIKISYEENSKREPVFKPLASVDRPNIKTFISVGHTSSHVNATKYAGNNGIPIVYDNKIVKVYDKYAPTIIHNVYPYPEDMDIHYGYSLLPVFFLQNTQNLIRCYSRGYVPPIHYCNIFQSNIGGKKDIDHYLRYFREMLKTVRNDEKIVLFGNCRGGAITIVALTYMTPEEQSKVSLVIVESVYMNVLNFLTNPKSKVKKIFGEGLAKIIAIGLNGVTDFSYKDRSPIEAIELYPLNIPIGFIATNKDEFIDLSATVTMYEKLKNRGHSNVHLCILDEADHCQAPIHNLDDQKKYLDFVNMLYDKYT